jgi:hypothetical protein
VNTTPPLQHRPHDTRQHLPSCHDLIPFTVLPPHNDNVAVVVSKQYFMDNSIKKQGVHFEHGLATHKQFGSFFAVPTVLLVVVIAPGIVLINVQFFHQCRTSINVLLRQFWEGKKKREQGKKEKQTTTTSE